MKLNNSNNRIKHPPKKIKFISLISFLIIIFYIIKCNNSSNNYYFKFNKFAYEIKKEFEIFYKVNINEIDQKINRRNKSEDNIKSIINIGITLDKQFVLETMITLTSIMSTQKKTTKVRFHLGVTNNFSVDKMLKIYNLRERINNITEFNFYYMKESVEKMQNFHRTKGIASPARFELPLYVPEDVDRLIIFDAGDLIILRDLTEFYNYNMGDYYVLGPPEPVIIDSFMKVKYNITKYINIGSILVNVKKLKEINFWNTFTSNRNIKTIGAPDQTLFNIVMPDNKKNYLPFKFGGFALFKNDKEYDSKIHINYHYKKFLNSNQSLTQPEKPKNEEGILYDFFNPVFIHQFAYKWKNGGGLSIYRLLNKYFILLTGIGDEICEKKPGYCI